MQTRLVGLSLCAVLLTVAVHGGETEWKEHKWDEGKITILLPGAPKAMANKAKGPDGTDITTSMLMVQKDKQGYLISFTPNAALANANEALKDAALDSGRDSAVKGMKGKLVEEKKLTLGDSPGREFLIESPIVGMYRARLYIIGDRLYQIVAFGPKDAVTSKDADKYFESFKLVK